ncbi:uncharacterized protein MONOS_7684 [Monocercomonoides exilis]|uniref:uncharacterized protein n=1 Tax=Monocercomonoides exilis TaxID=2049356 RepID=UPI00355946FC|nr:hypothetical protein MONOS_7684 [Monocercomonoides exilis]|eukprot:MONOS_7684.1-p1 / transcript=MONOS_7684.1 / gene=MONOS_7684 / organism=Monocercomonoides_exilis_PA203 / gene_product=unspecified product / transcript_product=unspecified product / location=Mono_scaffold00269:9548-11214(-) / protein_length=452 / sequence_SO=supercontig / SO=protein_coding / is_pseudo=false
MEKIEKIDINKDVEKKEESIGLITCFYLRFTNDEHLHFPKTTVVELGNLMKSIVNSAPKKGPPSTLSPHDKLIVYLEWLSSRTTLERISSFMGISQSMASNCLTDVRPALLSALNEMFSTPPRPPLIPNEEFPNVALLVDATTIKVPYPISTTFTEGKKLFDAHHSVYCIKIEVAVSSWKPYKALFVSDAIEGGKHDVFLFRKGMKRYEEYLKKTDEERIRNYQDFRNDSWAIMGDKGYQGHFPNIRLITPIKKCFFQELTSAKFSSEINKLPSPPRSPSPPSSPPSPPSFTSPQQLPPLPAPPPLPLIPQTESHSTFPECSQAFTRLPTDHFPETMKSSSQALSQLSFFDSSISSLTKRTSSSSTESSSSIFDQHTEQELDFLSIDEFNKSIARCRIPVEWFFGRMKKLWLRLSDTYSGGRENVGTDAKIECWLTNLVIDCHRLEDDDGN